MQLLLTLVLQFILMQYIAYFSIEYDNLIIRKEIKNFAYANLSAPKKLSLGNYYYGAMYSLKLKQST